MYTQQRFCCPEIWILVLSRISGCEYKTEKNLKWTKLNTVITDLWSLTLNVQWEKTLKWGVLSRSSTVQMQYFMSQCKHIQFYVHSQRSYVKQLLGSYCLPVHLSAWNNLASTKTDFCKILYRSLLLKIVDTFCFWSRSNKNRTNTLSQDLCTFILSHFMGWAQTAYFATYKK